MRNVDFEKNIPNIEKHNISTFYGKRKTGWAASMFKRILEIKYVSNVCDYYGYFCCQQVIIWNLKS